MTFVSFSWKNWMLLSHYASNKEALDKECKRFREETIAALMELLLLWCHVENASL